MTEATPNYAGTCVVCGATIVAYIRPSRKPPMTCSMACRRQRMLGRKQSETHVKNRILSGENHPNWKGDDAARQTGRSRALNWFPPKPCELCGEAKAERHHRDENTLNNAAENIQFLCRPCHLKQHNFHEMGGRRHARA